MCQPGQRPPLTLPQSAGCWKSPFLFLGCPVTEKHLQPARATPGEAAASASSCHAVCSASSNYLPPSPTAFCFLPRSPPPPTPPNTPPEVAQAHPYLRGNEHRRCSEGVHSSHEAVERPWGPLPTFPNLCTQKHHSAQEGNESQKVNLNPGPLLH